MIGHITWSCLLRRPVLSLINAGHRFCTYLWTPKRTVVACPLRKNSDGSRHSEPEEFTGRIIFMSMFNDISWGSKDNVKECESRAQLVSLYAKVFQQDNGHSSDLDQKRNGILLMNTVHQENGAELQNICRKQTPSLPIHESIIQRSA